MKRFNKKPDCPIVRLDVCHDEINKKTGLCLGFGDDGDEPIECCKWCRYCEGGYYQLGELND